MQICIFKVEIPSAQQIWTPIKKKIVANCLTTYSPFICENKLSNCGSGARKWFALFWQTEDGDWLSLLCFQLQQEVHAFLANSEQENQLRLFCTRRPRLKYIKYKLCKIFLRVFCCWGLLENDGSAIRKCWAIWRSCRAVCLGNCPGLQTPPATSQPGFVAFGSEWDGMRHMVTSDR